MPASVTKANYDPFAKSSALIAFRECQERTYRTVGQDGWQDVADFALDWARQHATTRVATMPSTTAVLPEQRAGAVERSAP